MYKESYIILLFFQKYVVKSLILIKNSVTIKIFSQKRQCHTFDTAHRILNFNIFPYSRSPLGRFFHSTLQSPIHFPQKIVWFTLKSTP